MNVKQINNNPSRDCLAIPLGLPNGTMSRLAFPVEIQNNISCCLAFYTYFYGDDNNVAFKIPKLPTIKYNCYYYTNNIKMFNKILKTQWIPIFIDVKFRAGLIESNFYGKHIKSCPHKYKELKYYDYLVFLDSKLEKISTYF